MASATDGEVREIKDFIRRCGDDLRRHDEERFLAAYAPSCTLHIGDMAVAGLGALRPLFQWYHRTYRDCSPTWHRLDVTHRGEEAEVETELELDLVTRANETSYKVEARAFYRVQRTPAGWHVAEHSMRVLRRRTLARHGALNFIRLMRHAKALRPSALPAAA